MNQILVTKKLYITPELKKKKKFYKFHFFLSVFLVCLLISICIYAEVQRNTSEASSQSILEDFNEETEDTTVAKNNVLVVLLDDENSQETTPSQEAEVLNKEENKQKIDSKIQTNKDGFNYKTVARIKIPKINVEYPILDGETDSVEETESLLKMSPTRFWGPEPNKIGNFCIVGHNYRNTRFFSKVPTLENGDTIDITDVSGKTITYSVYDKYEVEPEDLSCTSQLTDRKKEITLITCTNDSKLRVIVKARAI